MRKGFTLVELIVVIAIIGLLATVGISSYTNILREARDTKREADLTELKKIIFGYHTFTGSYPSGPVDASASLCCETTGDSFANPTNWIQGLVPTYAESLPVDPLNTATYQYSYQETKGGGFTLTAPLENSTTPFIITVLP